MKKLKIALISMLCIITTLIIVSFGYVYFKLNSVYVPNDNTNNKENIELEKINGVKNILLIGVDGNNLEKGNRSDSMMILTVDGKNKNLKLTSLARDTYVDIKGHSTEKLTHAYAYGGPELLIDTINSNFGITIDKYVAVSFSSFIKIIDLIGGVEVNIKENDINMLNKYIKTCYEFDSNSNKEEIQYIYESGRRNLNGYQALAFSRIRYQDSAYARDARQREVIEAAIGKFENTRIDNYIKTLDIVMAGAKTNISPTEALSLGFNILNIGTSGMKTLEFPVYKNPANLSGKGWVIQWDEESNLEVLNDFIFNNKDVSEER